MLQFFLFDYLHNNQVFQQLIVDVYCLKLGKLFLKNFIVALILLSLFEEAVWYSPFSNLLNRGILFIGFLNSSLSSKLAIPIAPSASLYNINVAGKISFSFSVASLYNLVILSFGV